MHDIDRTQMEYSPELSDLQGENDEFNQEWSGETYAETYGESLLSEADETELASELLEVNNEAELDQFLGKLLSRAARAAGSALRSPMGQALGGVLKGVAKKALPLAGGALGTFVGGPLGARIGSGLASAAGNALGLEAEALEQEDREFEGAKQFVRLGADTVNQAAGAPAMADARAVVQNAAIAAAQRHAPGLLSASGGVPGASRVRAGGEREGRWVRRGNRILLLGV